MVLGWVMELRNCAEAPTALGIPATPPTFQFVSRFQSPPAGLFQTAAAGAGSPMAVYVTSSIQKVFPLSGEESVRPHIPKWVSAGKSPMSPALMTMLNVGPPRFMLRVRVAA